MAFKQLHDDGGGYIIGKVCHYLYRAAVIFLFYQFFQVYLENILIDYGNIGILGKGILKDGDQGLIYLHRHDFPGLFRQILGHGSDTGSYFQHTVIRLYVCRVHDCFQHLGFYQEVLAVFFLKVKLIFLKYLNCSAGRTYFGHKISSVPYADEACITAADNGPV